MDIIISVVLPYILLYKYWAIFTVTLLAALAFPIPPGALLMASAAFASQGYLSFAWIVVVGSLGNIVGDNMGYWLARLYGKHIFYKIGLRKVIESERYKEAEKRLNKKSGFIIFITRFEVFSNLVVNILCGLSKVSYRKYLTHLVFGEVCQVLLYCSIGYMVGDNWQLVSKMISKSLLVTIILLVLFVVLFRKKIWVRK